MSDINITERRADTVLILDVDGNLILGENCTKFRNTLRRLVENGEKKILLNLAGVSYIDSSGLGELVSSYNSLKKIEGKVKLVNLSDKVQDLMILTKLLTIFDIYKSEAEAIEEFNNPEVKTAHVSPPVSEKV